MKKIVQIFTFSFILTTVLTAQTNETLRSKEQEVQKNNSGLTLGGYGEATYSRNFYSDNVFRYMTPDKYKNDPAHGRFDLPHVVFFVGYEFGNGWRMNSEIEFEHGGTESAMEIEPEEGGEYEAEVERGGEVVLEQFWIEKTFSRALNLRMGHLIVPVGLTNGNHLPTQFFTVFRPQGERTILPCTWHETGASLWGRIGKWRYEAQILAGLDSELFGSDRWISGASASPYEFKVGNKLATALRFDNYSISGLRLGVSGYYGQSFNNGIKTTSSDKYKGVKGEVMIGSFDFEYNNHNWVARGYFDYGHLGDAQTISLYNRNLPNQSASPRSNVASNALAAGVEVGYDLFSQIPKLKQKKQKFYLFGRYEFFDSMYKVSTNITDQDWCGRKVMVGGVNYYPIKDVVIKAEYSVGLMTSAFKNENAINLGIAYAGFFTK
ncbi:MAG: hypothetical protein PHX50_07300 [Massilibacteroides sp.]|nr:hypothetical protein [Massilibacteroides sp.]